MFQNYLRVFSRHLVRQKNYAIINIVGLAIGLTCSIFIMMWVLNETSYDRFHADSERIFQVMDNQTYSDGKTFTFQSVPGLLGEAMRTEVPEIEFASNTTWEDNFLVTVGDKAIKEKGFYAEPDFFRIFDFKLISGNRDNIFPDKNSIAISRKTAEKYFGSTDVLGKVLKVENKMDLKITAVFSDVPSNSSLQFDVVMPYKIYLDSQSWLKNWGSNGVLCFAKLHKSSAVNVVDDKIKLMAKKRQESAVAEFWLQPYTRHHLYSSFDKGREAGGPIEYVRIFSVVSVFILVIACINFLNLATARAMNRAKEVGVRKVAGAQRWSLINQFLSEAFIMTCIALVVAIMLVSLLLPIFNQIVGKPLKFNLTDPVWFISLTAIILLTTLFSGGYPAFFLSSLKPVTVLRKSALNFGTGTMRKSLVIFQFSLSIILIITSLIVYRQINFIRNKNLGLNKENVLFFWTPSDAFKSLPTYKTELLAHAGVKNVAISNQNPLQFGSSSSLDSWPGKKETDDILFDNNAVDENYFDTMGMEIAEGRNFNGSRADSLAIIFSEEAIKQMGLVPPVIGQQVKYDTFRTIIGVVKDFHSVNLKYNVNPVMFTNNVTWGQTLIKIEPSQAKDVIAHIESVYKKFNPGYPFSYDFLDQSFESQYKREKMIGRLSICFTTVAIVISLLGLYSLAAFTAEQRVKEIGIRKALGASVLELVMMLCGSFSKLIVIALLIGSPIAYYLMNDFLKGYANHTEFPSEVFLVTALIILFISLCTVVYQAAKAALLNPTASLRSE